MVWTYRHTETLYGWVPCQKKMGKQLEYYFYTLQRPFIVITHSKQKLSECHWESCWRVLWGDTAYVQMKRLADGCPEPGQVGNPNPTVNGETYCIFTGNRLKRRRNRKDDRVLRVQLLHLHPSGSPPVNSELWWLVFFMLLFSSPTGSWFIYKDCSK